MQPKGYSERTVEVEGWQVRLKSYELDGVFHCSADNVSPGANLARMTVWLAREALQQRFPRAARRRPSQAMLLSTGAGDAGIQGK